MKKNRTRFKVGSTGNPLYRSNGYDNNLYKLMYVVYRTSSLNYMIEIEENLINYYQEHYRNDNLIRGSAGPAPAQSNSFFVYVVVGRKKYR